MVIINEFFPNPAGKDTEGEWIKLFNNGDSAVNIAGWQIKDASGKAFIFSTALEKNNIISAGEILTIDYKTTKISLNNNGETIFLYDKSGVLIDKAEYTGSAIEGKTYTRSENGKFVLGGSDSRGQTTQNLYQEIPATNSGVENSNFTVDAKFPFSLLNFSIGIFIALVLTALFILISKKLELFSYNNK